jgi:sugar fermentation stimulation protein A
MKVAAPLLEAILLRRVNRFTIEAELRGRTVLAHLHNSGRLPYLLMRGKRVLLRPITGRPQRKTQFDLVFVRDGEHLVSVEATLPNKLVAEAIRAGQIRGLRGYRVERSEVTLDKSRFDLLLQKGRDRLFVEVKSVTLVKEEMALFPDSPTRRGQRHLRGLTQQRKRKLGAAVIFAIMHPKAAVFSPNREVDPDFAESLSRAAKAGVHIGAYRFRTTRDEITVDTELPTRGL